MNGDPGNNLLFYNFNSNGPPVQKRPGERKYVSESSDNGDQINSYDIRKDNMTPSRCSLQVSTAKVSQKSSRGLDHGTPEADDQFTEFER